MHLFSSLKDCSLAFFKSPQSLHLAIGMFDGVHLGHQALLQQMPLSDPASSCGILSFSPHPSRIVRPQEPTLLCMPYPQQERHLARLGIDFIIRHPFDRTLASTTALDFLNDLKHYMPTLKGLYVGQAFRFGQKREGDTSLLGSWAASQGLDLKILTTFEKNGRIVSSSNIRELIVKGEFQAAKALLGYAYYAYGALEGLPQAPCLQWQPELAPPDGMYKAYIPDLDLHTTLDYQNAYILLNKDIKSLEKLSTELKIEFLECR